MRLIDAEELERMGYVLTRTYRKDKATMVYENKKLSDVPSAQLEIIRCKDCKHWAKTWTNDNWSPDSHYCSFIDGRRNGDWYCADAEREEE